eukprot:gene10216-8132_t
MDAGVLNFGPTCSDGVMLGRVAFPVPQSHHGLIPPPAYARNYGLPDLGQKFRGFAAPREEPDNGAPVSASSERDEEKREPLSQDVFYAGPLSKTHKILKRISIANTAIAFGAAPYILEFGDISYASRIGLASTLVFFGLITTGSLHWITHPYVHELKFVASTQMLEAKTTTLFGMKNDVKLLPWDRPVATFMAQGRFYYIDVYDFPDEDLLKKLAPTDDVPAGYKDDQYDD